MDNKIRAAAENDMPGYDDKAWQKMEAALDQHLPQKDKKRRMLFFLLFAMLLSIPTFFILRNISTHDTPLVTAGQTSQKEGEKNTAVNPSLNPAQGEKAIPPPAAPRTSEVEKITTPTTTDANTNSLTNELTQENTNSKETRKKAIAPIKAKNNNAFDIAITNGAASGKNKPATTTDKPKTNAPAQNILTAPSDVTTVTNPSSTDKTDATTKETASSVKKEKKDSIATAFTTDKPAKKEQKKKESFISRFAFNFSAGADLSSVGFNYPGKVKSEYGIGLSYAISKKWTVRTGFYVGRKIYSADSTNYKTPYTGGFYSYRLDRIDANCLVYEVPVSMVYNFGQSKKHNWFASAGLSSYFMKKEDYVYNYKAPSGDRTSFRYEYNNENKHLFSVLGLSAGYQYHFTDRLSLLAEPYVKLPLSGVGFGKAKLNSVGAMFTLSYKPFKK